MILRLSKKLNTKIKAGKLTDMPLHKNSYADWSCHLFTAYRMQYIIMSNTKSLYSCVMYGKGITDNIRFLQCVLSAIRGFMEDDGQAFVYQCFISAASALVSFAKAFSRCVTGSMNELISFPKLWLIEGDISPHDVRFKLNDVLLSALATEKSTVTGSQTRHSSCWQTVASRARVARKVDRRARLDHSDTPSLLPAHARLAVA